MVTVKKSEDVGDSCIRELETLMREITQTFYDMRATGQGPFSEIGRAHV